MNTQIMMTAMSGDVASIDKFYEEFEPIAKNCIKRFIYEHGIALIDYPYFDFEDIVQEVMVDSFSRILKNFKIEKSKNLNILGFTKRIVFNSVKHWVTRNLFTRKMNFNDGDEHKTFLEESGAILGEDTKFVIGAVDPRWTPEDVVLYESLKGDILSKVESFKLTDWSTHRVFPSRHVDISDYLKIAELFLDGCRSIEVSWYFTKDAKNQFWRKLSFSFLKDVLSPIVLMEIDNPIYYKKYESKLSKKAKKFIRGEGFYLKHSLFL